MNRAMLFGGLAGLLASCAIPIFDLLIRLSSHGGGACYTPGRSEVLMAYQKFYLGLGLFSLLIGPIIGVLAGFSRHVTVSVLIGVVAGLSASCVGLLFVTLRWICIG